MRRSMLLGLVLASALAGAAFAARSGVTQTVEGRAVEAELIASPGDGEVVGVLLVVDAGGTLVPVRCSPSPSCLAVVSTLATPHGAVHLRARGAVERGMLRVSSVRAQHRLGEE